MSLWLFLLLLLVVQGMVYSLAISLAEYSRRAVYDHFTAKTASLREVKGLPYADLMNRAGKTYGVSPELVAAIIKAESAFDPRALSKAGAYGIMQVMPDTWRLVNRQALVCTGRHDGECGSDCFYNPELNIAVGTCYLGELMKRYKNHAELAVAAYNAGPGAVDKYGGIPPYAETKEYVGRVINYWYRISGQLPPGLLSNEIWLKITVVLSWSMMTTAAAVIVAGRCLFKRFHSFYWR
ncbi:lytic transglycosylase domain-containing protein [Sporomusa acidovorans]|uniref:lytic transglycosylase domain-containing protein n=1 Tax=Sporomusa acidovorans TaxID=112900 RepID=UPI00118178E1|nr:lytic transglycosylase domain-containing protein [Sporomusa acidovorans]